MLAAGRSTPAGWFAICYMAQGLYRNKSVVWGPWFGGSGTAGPQTGGMLACGNRKLFSVQALGIYNAFAIGPAWRLLSGCGETA